LDHRQLSPALIKLKPDFRLLITVHYPRVLKNEISVREFWEEKEKGNLNKLLLNLYTHNDKYKLYDNEIREIESLLSDIPTKLGRIRNYSIISSDDNNEIKIRQGYAHFIKIFSELLKIDEDDDNASMEPEIRSRVNTYNNDKEKIMEKLYVFTESVCELRSGIDHLCDASKDEQILKRLIPTYKTPSQKFKEDYQNLIKDIQDNLPEDISDKIKDTNQKLSSQIDKLIEFFSNSHVDILSIESTMNYIERKVLWEVLWRVTLQSRIENS